MIVLVKRFLLSTIHQYPLIVLVIVFCTACSLTDNSTRLANQLESASKELKTKKNGSEIIIHYKTEDNNAPFTILLTSEKGVTSNELYKRGLDSSFVEHLFDLKKGAALAVFQHCIISSTSYYLRFVDVAATQIIKGIGKTDIVVKKVDVSRGRFTEKVTLIELHKAVNN